MTDTMHKVLIITYYWIPSGGAGVQRWVKFAKYLPTYSILPTIYTPKNPEYPSIDHSLETDISPLVNVIKTQIWEPYNIYRQLFGKKGEKINAGFISENKKSGWKEKLSIWIRGNCLIPDPRKFWIKPSVRYLKKYLVENNIDTIITTGPPHSMHLIGLRLKKKIPHIRWVADFRDPWTKIDFYKDLRLNPISDYLHHRWERKVVSNADHVIVVSTEMYNDFRQLNPHNIQLITNGYDTDDIPKKRPPLDEKFTLSHIGTLNASRNPHTLWEVLSELVKEDDTFEKSLQIQLIGKTDFSVLDSIDQYGLSPYLKNIAYLPHHEAIKYQQRSQLLLLLINRVASAKGILTGKLFEYMAAKRPILAIAPTLSDVAQVITETKAGKVIDFDDKEQMKKIVRSYFVHYKNKTLDIQTENIEKYSRKELTKKLAKML